jgi:hypothetical protein
MNNEDISYLTDGYVPKFAMESEKTSAKDEMDYSTLNAIRDELEQYMVDLRSDFNAFDLEGDPEVSAKRLMIEVKVNKEVYRVLSTIVAKVNSVVQGADFNPKP